MSSHESPAPIPAEADDALFVAVVQVCETSFFAYVESCEPVRFAALVQPLDSPSAEWLKSSVAFTGSLFSGTVEVMLPVRLARQLVASLLGVSQQVELHEVEVLDHQVFDGIGEFANMICGAWLTDLGGSQAFQLEPPKVTRMPSDWSPMADSSEKDDHGYRLCVNDLPLRIRVLLSTD